MKRCNIWGLLPNNTGGGMAGKGVDETRLTMSW